MEITLSDKTKISLREPTVLDMRIVSKIENDAERELALSANLTGLTSAELDKLLYKDYAKIQEGLASFLS